MGGNGNTDCVPAHLYSVLFSLLMAVYILTLFFIFCLYCLCCIAFCSLHCISSLPLSCCLAFWLVFLHQWVASAYSITWYLKLVVIRIIPDSNSTLIGSGTCILLCSKIIQMTTTLQLVVELLDQRWWIPVFRRNSNMTGDMYTCVSVTGNFTRAYA